MTQESKRELKELHAKFMAIEPYSLDAYIGIVNELVKKHPLSYFSIIKAARFEKLQTDILEKTKFLDEWYSQRDPVRFYYYIHKLDKVIECETCKTPYTKNFTILNAPEYFHCNTFCAQQNPKVIESIRTTKEKNHTTTKDLLPRTVARNQEKYGCDWYYQSKDFEKKKLAAWKANGYDHPMHSDEVKQGMGDRYEAKHGVRHNFANPEVIAKIKKTNLKNLGVEWPSQNPQLKKIMVSNAADTQKREYYNNTILNYEHIEPMFSEDDYAAKSEIRANFKWKCKKCGHEFKQELFKYGREPRCLVCNPLIYDKATSNLEKEFYEFLIGIKDSKYECIYNQELNWNLLGNGQQLDVVCVDRETKEPKLAFEFDGIYWHSVKNKPKNYHLDKTKICEELDICLVHVLESDWKAIVTGKRLRALIISLLHGENPLESMYPKRNRIVLDRSIHCKLLVPSGYVIVEETAPRKCSHLDARGKVHEIEDCGCLICEKISI